MNPVVYALLVRFQGLPRPLRLSLAAGATFVVGFSAYMFINHWSYANAHRAVSIPFTVENHIPFLPWTVLIYAWALIFLFIPLFLIRFEPFFYRLAAAQLLSVLIASVFFLAWPLHIERPQLAAYGSFWEWGVLINYWLDKPTNCFPSLHVSNSFLSAFATLHLNRRLGMLALGGAAAIAVSILTMKQHYFIDMVGGALLAYFCYRLIVSPLHKRMEQLPGNEVCGPLWPASFVIVLYVLIVGGMFILYTSGFKPPLP